VISTLRLEVIRQCGEGLPFSEVGALASPRPPNHREATGASGCDSDSMTSGTVDAMLARSDRLSTLAIRSYQF